MAIESRGVPCVLAVSSAFEKLAQTIVGAKGSPGARMIVFEHPLGGLTEERVREKGRLLAARLLALLAPGR